MDVNEMAGLLFQVNNEINYLSETLSSNKVAANDKAEIISSVTYFSAVGKILNYVYQEFSLQIAEDEIFSKITIIKNLAKKYRNEKVTEQEFNSLLSNELKDFYTLKDVLELLRTVKNVTIRNEKESNSSNQNYRGTKL